MKHVTTRWAIALILTVSPGPVSHADTILAETLLPGIAEQNSPAIAAILQSTEQSMDVDISDTTDTQGEALVDLGSITKFVTAVMILHLVEEGRLTLDAPLATLLPDVPQDKAAITLHQLLTHTSGLSPSTGSDSERLSRAAFLNRLRNAPLTHKPGERYLYSNAGYSLLAAIIEVTSGQSYETYLQNQILAPKGLPPIGYEAAYDPARALHSNRTWRTAFRRLPIRAASWGGHAPGWNLIGNGGAVSTAEGFLTFWQAFVEGRIVSEDLVRLALLPHADEGGGESHYGYGLVVEDIPHLGRVYWHDGGNEIFSAEWRYIKSLNTTLFAAGTGPRGFIVMETLISGLKDR